MLSVVIPTLQAAGDLAPTVDSVARAGFVDEIIVSDGGSTDGTQALAKRLGARVVNGPRGRGQQLREGGRTAAGEWLLFLHGDTVLGGDWRQMAASFMGGAGNRRRAAVFKFALDDPSMQARWFERLVNFRGRLLALPYGDQGLLISRGLYTELGGYHPIPLFEDVEMIRRIGRRRLVFLGAPAVTSARRYRAQGYVLRPLLNVTCLSLYFAGLPPKFIGRLYH